MRSISTALLLVTVLLGGFLMAGCDDNVEVIRDPEIHLKKGMTWAWRPPAAPDAVKRAPDGRPITSTDVIKQQAPPLRKSSRVIASGIPRPTALNCKRQLNAPLKGKG